MISVGLVKELKIWIPKDLLGTLSSLSASDPEGMALSTKKKGQQWNLGYLNHSKKMNR